MCKPPENKNVSMERFRVSFQTFLREKQEHDCKNIIHVWDAKEKEATAEVLAVSGFKKFTVDKTRYAFEKTSIQLLEISFSCSMLRVNITFPCL